MVWGVLAGAASGADRTMTSMENRALSKTNRTIAEAEESRKAQMFEAQVALAESMKMRGLVDDPQGWQAQFSPQAQGAALPADGMGPPAAAPVPDRRTRYKQWFDKAAQSAAMTGGLEGFYKFQEMEDATSRRQVLGYALQAVNAMDEGNVGEAMRAGNAALEVTPFDTGLKFEARDGNLYLVGANGKAGQPLDANHLRAFAEDNLRTPENYLNFKAQYETERSAKAREALGKQRADATSLQAETYAAERDSRELLRKAQAYSALARGQAALAPDTDDALRWDENNILRIQELQETALNGGLGFGGMWMSEGAQNSELFNQATSDAVEIRIANAPDAMTHEEAAAISRMAHFVDLKDNEGGMVPPDTSMLGLLGDTRVFTDDQGNFMVNYKGKNLIVPPSVGVRINQNKQFVAE